MVRINRVYTRAGDDGTTALIGGQRIPKDSPRIEAYGTIDELNSVIGAAVSMGIADALRQPFFVIQQVLFNLGSELATEAADLERIQLPKIEQRHVTGLERWIDEWNEELPPLKSFVLPGGHPAAAQLHVARTVCRRAERLVISLARESEVRPEAIAYLNRLSDLLFVAARYQNDRSGVDEPLWDSRGF